MLKLEDNINFNPNLSSSSKSFLRALESHCRTKPVCWPSQRRIALFMGTSTRTVQRCQKEAQELALISVKRRFLKSSVITMHCLVECQTAEPPVCRKEPENIQEQENVRNGSERKPVRIWKSPSDIKLIIEDLTEILGPEVAKRNHGWLWRIARTVEDSAIYESISWLKQAIIESELAGDTIRSASSLLCWRLRSMGVLPI